MAERADAVAARTTTVHGNLGEKSLGASEYHAALSRLCCSRGDNAPYVPGHCFFSSVAFSSPIASGYSHLQGARLIRSRVASVYKNRKFQGLFRTYLSPENGKMWPGHESDELVAPGVALSTTKDSWHQPFLHDRAIMMETVDVSSSTSDMWKYSCFLDHIGIVSASSVLGVICHVIACLIADKFAGGSTVAPTVCCL